LRHRSRRQFLFAGFQAAERRLYLFFKGSGRFASTVRLQALPVKGVVPALSCIIEDRGLVRLSGSGGDDFFQGEIGKFRI